MTSFNGPQAVNVFAMTALASALRMYDKHKMIPNRNYTPTKMLKAAEIYTGQKFKRGEYARAAEVLKATADKAVAEIHAGEHPGNSITA